VIHEFRQVGGEVRDDGSPVRGIRARAFTAKTGTFCAVAERDAAVFSLSVLTMIRSTPSLLANPIEYAKSG
jgi:hypothetical protein